MNRITKGVVIVTVTAAAGFGLGACSAGTTPDMCAYTQGTGQNGSDAKVHDIYLPGEQFTPGSDENTYYFPCNSRNLRLTAGSTDKHADGTPVGPLTLRDSKGSEVVVSIRMDWTLNENKDVIRDVFIPWCAKYNCASTDSAVRNDNFSTDGWSLGFLGENAVPAFESSTRDAMLTMDDTVTTDPTKKQELATKVSDNFMKSIRGTMGSTQDLFCGSGETSGWSDPSKPGADGTTFSCAPVRITVEDIQLRDQELIDLQARESKADKAKQVNAKELAAAKEKYGPDAGKVLGDLDKIKECASAGERCNVYVGNVPATQ